MNMNEFLESDMEIYEITKEEYIEMAVNNTLEWYRESKIDITDNLINQARLEGELFYKEAIQTALEKHIDIREEILKDYKELVQTVQEKERKAIEMENSKILLTYNMIQHIKVNTKLIIDGYKVTLKEIKEDCIICKPYKSRNKSWSITLNNKVNSFEIGWN